MVIVIGLTLGCKKLFLTVVTKQMRKYNMKLVKQLLNKKIINSNGYTRSDTGTSVHSYLRLHPKNKGILRKVTKIFIDGIKK